MKLLSLSLLMPFLFVASLSQAMQQAQSDPLYRRMLIRNGLIGTAMEITEIIQNLIINKPVWIRYDFELEQKLEITHHERDLELFLLF